MAAGSRTLPIFLAGLLLLLLGALWTTVDTAGYLPRFVLVAGVVLLALFLIRNAGEIRFLLLQARERAEPGPTATLLLLALVLALGGLLAGRLLAPVDLTAERLNSLSGGSRRTLAALDGPLRIEAYYADPSPEWTYAGRLLSLYARGSRHVRTSLHDPDREPARAREAGVGRTGTIVVTRGEARLQVYELSEEAITQGILAVLEGRPRFVGLVQGHGEPTLAAGGDQGLTGWMQALQAVNVSAREVRLLDADEVPEDLDALLVVRPRSPLFESELGILRRYLERGGRIGFWLEPADSTGLEGFLGFYYLGVLPGMIRDTGRATAGLGLGVWSPALVGDPRHPVTAGLTNFVAASGAGGLEIESPHPMDLIAEPFLRSAGPVEVFAEAQAAGRAPLRRGVETVGAALEWSAAPEASGEEDAGGLPPVKRVARLLVLADASPVTNRFLGMAANRDLAIGAVHWLTSQEHFLGSQRERARPAALRIGARGLRTLLYVVEFGLPALLIAAGVWVWMRRRVEAAR
ncbi:MAG: GldG family protein [Candidatus Eisenbacteria bacterium]|uniref:GldG family protein n=1 Tax=Eiseniibacteriota bacterium TaxID=2212470 RepID=A0A937XD71_UNCEI|nr:GldG family protein [Candidatus Eisenbacteria bacterium]